MINPWAKAEEQVQFPISIRLVTNPFDTNHLMASPVNELVQGVKTTGPWRNLIREPAEAYDLVIDLAGDNEDGKVFPVNDDEYNFFFIRAKAKREWVDSGFTCCHKLAEIFRKHKCRLQIKPFSNPWG